MSDLKSLLDAFPEDVAVFVQSDYLTPKLEEALWDHYFSNGSIVNYNCDASGYLAERLADELGLV